MEGSLEEAASRSEGRIGMNRGTGRGQGCHPQVPRPRAGELVQGTWVLSFRSLGGAARGCLGPGARLTLIFMLWLASMSQDTEGGPCRMSTASGCPEVQLSFTSTVTVRGLRADRALAGGKAGRGGS